MREYNRIICLIFIICLLAGMVVVITSAEQNSDQSQKTQREMRNAQGPGVGVAPDQRGPGEMRPRNGTPGERGYPPDFANNTEFRERIISDLESKGIDTTELRAAMDSGDQEKIRQIMDSYRDKLPFGPQNGTAGPGSGDKRPMEGQANQDGSADVTTPGITEVSSEVQSAQQSEPIPTPTKSPISLISTLAGIGAIGLTYTYLKRE